MTEPSRPVGRRGLFAVLGAGALGVGLMSAARATDGPASGAEAGGEPWRPTREPQDDWMELPGRHRMVFDAISPKGAGDALAFADTFILANRLGYRIEAKDLGVIIVLRHLATPFAFGDPIWARYGGLIGRLIKFNDPLTRRPPHTNLYLTRRPGKRHEDDATLPELTRKGARFAVCGMATQGMSGLIAKQTGQKAEAVHAELVANLIPSAHLAAAGIVAVNRAQERGYALAYIG